MRPRELTISGFRSYADEVTFEWSDRSLVGIVGPIGSGKSSILDAIAFALYGKTPRIERETKSLINQRRDIAQISLVFEVDGTTWKAVRALRRGGASAHALYRVEGADDVEVADKQREMTERVESLLGLDFKAFTRSVLLAQNQFAAFLEATPGDRDDVLVGVFGFEMLEEMRSATKLRLDEVDRGLAMLEGRRATAATDAADVESKRTALTAAEGREKALEDLRVPFQEAKATIDASTAKIEDADLRLGRLGELAERIPDRERADAVIASATEGAGRIEAAQQATAAAESARTTARELRDAELEAAGGRQGIDELTALVERWRSETDGLVPLEAAERKAESEHEVAVLGAGQADLASEAARDRETASIRASEEARESVEAARALLTAAQQEHRAHALRSELTVGEPCPVCGLSVQDVPEGSVPDSIEAAEAALDSALAAAAEASKAAAAAAAEMSEARAAQAAAGEAKTGAAKMLEEARRRTNEARAAIGRSGSALVERIGPGDFEANLADRRSRLDEAERALTAADEALETARAAEARTRTESEHAAGVLSSLRTEVAAASGSLDVGIEVGEGAEDLQRAIVGLREAWIGKQQAAEGDRARAAKERDAAAAAQRQLVEAAGLGESDDVVEVIAAARAERAGLEAEVHLLETRLAELAELEKDQSELVARSDLLRTLHQDLTRSAFPKFLLDDRRRILDDLASEHLETLTGGRYRFDGSGEFLLVDLTAADSVRSPASLSGGETFLASLALALALAEIVSREGGRLDAFFLDEGFGSLDPEHLDLAMSGVERLVTSGPERLVVVVSHVPAMRERIEDLVVLDRDPMTGNTQVVAGRTAS